MGDALRQLHRRGRIVWVRMVLARSAVLCAIAVVATVLLAVVRGLGAPPSVTLDAAGRSDGAPEEYLLTGSGHGLDATRARLDRATAILDYAAQYRIPAELSTAIYDIAVAEGIHPALGFQLVKVESRFRATARSSRGAIGYTQIRLPTAREFLPTVTEARLAERDLNLRLGFRFLRTLVRRFDGDLALALVAYNRGPTRVDSLLVIGENPSNGYSEAVMRGLAGAARRQPMELRRGS